MEIYQKTFTKHMYYPCREIGQNCFENSYKKFLTPYAYNVLDQIKENDFYYESWATLYNENKIYVVLDKNRYSDFCAIKLYGFIGNYLIEIVAPDDYMAKTIYSLCHKNGKIFQGEINFCHYIKTNSSSNFTPQLDVELLGQYFTAQEFKKALFLQTGLNTFVAEDRVFMYEGTYYEFY